MDRELGLARAGQQSQYVVGYADPPSARAAGRAWTPAHGESVAYPDAVYLPVGLDDPIPATTTVRQSLSVHRDFQSGDEFTVNLSWTIPLR